MFGSLDLTHVLGYPPIRPKLLPYKAPTPEACEATRVWNFGRPPARGRLELNTVSAAYQQPQSTEKVPKSSRRPRGSRVSEHSDAARVAAIFAPPGHEFHGTWIDGTPTLYGDFIGCARPGWDVLRWGDSDEAIASHFDAGQQQQAVRVEGFDYPIRAVALAYDLDKVAEFISFDLDGGYDARKVIRGLVKYFGKNSILPISGSGAAGRFRLLVRLSKPLLVHRILTLATAIAARAGFPVQSKHLEVFPSRCASRMPFGCGGCQLYDFTLTPLGKPDQAVAMSAFLDLDPVDLEAIVEAHNIDSGIDTRWVVRGRYDPYTRRERARSRPAVMQDLLDNGITQSGQRDRAIFLFVRDCLYSGNSYNEAVGRLIAWIEDGKIDASDEIKRYGRGPQIKRVPRIVAKLYATLAALGTPDPIPLTPLETIRAHELAKVMAVEACVTFRLALAFLLKALPWFKGAAAAGLPMLRMHSSRWKTFGGRNYKKLRNVSRLFRAMTGYRSLESVNKRAHLGAKASEAHARSYSCCFWFDLGSADVPSYVLSNARNTDRHDHSDRSSLVSTTQLLSTPAANPTTDHTQTPRLYVVQSQDQAKSKGSEDQIQATDPKVQPTQGSTVITTTQIVSPPTQAKPTDGTLPVQSRPKKRPARRRSDFALPVRQPRPEWQRLRMAGPVCTDDMELDDFFNAVIARKELIKQYEREKAKARKLQKAEVARVHHDIPMRRFVTARFWELQKELGISWD
jgi:hypothetical protein